jgi:hypothetical protein
MEAIVVNRNELKDLLRETIREELGNFIPKYDFVSLEEQEEIENLHYDILKDKIHEKDLIEL